MFKYKKYIVKQFVVIHNGYKYSITAPDEFTYVGAARNIKECKEKINQHIKENKKQAVSILYHNLDRSFLISERIDLFYVH